MSVSQHRKRFGAALVRAAAATGTTVLAVSVLATAPASAATNDKGLFGEQDPTYDGVYRQGLAITGLVAVQAKVPARSLEWLLEQQCGNGAFQSYRADTDQECGKSDPQTFSGPDSNSTAMAAMALAAAGKNGKADKALHALLKFQSADGGFTYYKGADGDANSTGLALTALKGSSEVGTKSNLRDAKEFLKKLQLKCKEDKSQRGMVSYVASSPLLGNDLASAQTAMGLVTTLPSASNPQERNQPKITCDNGRPVHDVNLRDSVMDALSKRLNANDGLLPGAFGGTDPSATAQAVIALEVTGRAADRVAHATKQLKAGADDYTGAASSPLSGALGTLMLVADVTGSNPEKFGGVDLVETLLATRR